MNSTPKSTTLYKTPFSPAYWRDAAAELKDVKMLVFAAMMMALRLVLKLVYVPLAPGLNVNTAFIANAMGAMVYGPVMAALCAVITDVLGFLMNPVGVYFPPFVLTEVAGSVIFALFLYRSKLTPVRVMLSRFCICFFVNVVLQTPIYIWYYSLFMDGKTYALTIPGIVKNLFMFPIETVVLTIFLSFIQPITYRMKLTYNAEASLKFTKAQIATLVVLFVFGAGCVTGYLAYYYNHTSLTVGYSTEERIAKNQAMDAILDEKVSGGADDRTVAIVESSYKPLFGGEITYTVAQYAVDDAVAQGSEDYEALWNLKKTPASKDPSLTRLGTATIVTNKKTDALVSCEYQAETK